MRLFSHDPAVLRVGALYLREAAPCYGFFDAGLMLYFASQGAGRMVGPFVAGAVRLLVAAGLGWLSVARWHVELGGLFALVAAASALFGGIAFLAVGASPWTARRT